MAKTIRRWQLLLSVGVALVATAAVAAGVHFRLGPLRLAEQVLRVAVTPLLARLYRADDAWVAAKVESYWHGLPVGADQAGLPPVPPFIYEDPQAPIQRKLRERYQLDQFVEGAPSEYEAILRLGGWAGSQFDHGTDPLAGGEKVCDPVALVEAGRAGAKYWCEIAARLLVHAANSVGIPSRIITASSDGYTWEHAVAEVWSNEFGKWILVDPDFNLVYEHGGIPLSAVEILSKGEFWHQEGTLGRVSIAPAKPSIPSGDPLPLYRYMHLDMRTDWCTRPLRRGSPAGGDRATLWYARPTTRKHVLTSKVEVANAESLNWALNRVTLIRVPGENGDNDSWAPATFSPYFDHFERDQGDGWQAVAGPLRIHAGEVGRLRVVTEFGWRGQILEYGK